MMRKAILHIGMHKTGSSTIQSYLQSKGDCIDNNFIYADLGPSNHSGPFSFAFTSKPELDPEISRMGLDIDSVYRNKEIYLNAVIRSLKKKFGTIIFSGEGIIKLSEDELKELKIFLLKYVDIIEVYAYVRRPEEFMASAFQQVIKTNYVELTSSRIFPNYKGRFEKFETVFGSVNYRLFSSSTLLNKDVVNDFCDWVNIPYTGIERVNESLSHSSVKLLYYIQKYRKYHQLSQEGLSLIEKTFSVFNDSRFALPKQVVDSNMSMIGDDISWMQRRVDEKLSKHKADIGNNCLPSPFVVSRAEADLFIKLIDNKEFLQYLNKECDLSLYELLHLASFEDSDMEYICNVKLVNDNIVGWALNKSNPTKKVDLSIFVNGFFHGDITASSYREDLIGKNNVGDEYLGFSYPLGSSAGKFIKVFYKNKLVFDYRGHD